VLLDRRRVVCPTCSLDTCKFNKLICGDCTGSCDVFFATRFDCSGFDCHWFWNNALTGGYIYPIEPNVSSERVTISSDVQAKYLERLKVEGKGTGEPAQRLWSKIHQVKANESDLLFTLTAPIAYCGNYSCFRGAIGADINLGHVSDDCFAEWSKLAHRVASPEYQAYIGPKNSSVFILMHYSEFYQDQEGLLLGTSDPSSGDYDDMMKYVKQAKADQSTQDIVRHASKAILAKFKSWRSLNLTGEHFFEFNVTTHEVDSCAQRDSADECRQVGTLSVKLDNFSRILVVVVLPSGSFDRLAKETTDRVKVQVEEQQEKQDSASGTAKVIAAGFCAGCAAGAVLVGCLLGWLVSQPLHGLSEVMQRIGRLDFDKESAILDDLASGRYGWIKDIQELHAAFHRLTAGIQHFMRFVPKTVVQGIVNGAHGATRLHVVPREVTCMFMSIKEFNKISESLTSKALIQVLKTAHPVMTSIVEKHRGAVAEVLDDGLLVYWNSHDTVSDHWLHACRAGLAQVNAMDDLNAQLAAAGLPRLEIQIGIHTGYALSGNLGSDKKMKFGCIGDTVNLTSRLNNLCKHFGVQILCSAATQQNAARHEIVCRELSCVKVKGKREDTKIFEVLGTLRAGDGRHHSSFSTETSRASQASSGTGTSRSAKYFLRIALGALPSPYRSESPGRAARRQRASANPTPVMEVARPGTSRSVESREEKPSEQGVEKSVVDENDKESLEGKEVNRLPSAAEKKRCATSSGVGSARSLRSAQVSIASGTSPGARSVPTRHTEYPVILGTGASMGAAGPAPDQVGDVTFPVSPERLELKALYEEALWLYQVAEFAAAREILEDLHERHPDDLATTRLLRMASQYLDANGEIVGLTAEELQTWNGVESMTKK